MAAAAVTSPDAFTLHPNVAPPAATPADVDGDEFEFRVVPAAAAALSAADELFSGGKLVPFLPPPQPLPPPCSPPPCLELEPTSEPTSPRAPRCAGRRWRDLLLLVSNSRKAKSGGGGDDDKCADGCLKRRETHFRPLLSRDSSSSSSASSVDSGKNARRPPPPSRSPLRTRSAPVANLLHLMSRRPTGDRIGAADASLNLKRQEPCAHPLLTRVSSSSSASSSDSGRNPRAPWPQRAPARPSRPAVAAESPRVSASGRVVFRGLERSSSTPASAGIGPRRPRPRGMERSYSANVRVDPVINVFGFGHLFMPSSPAKEKKADKERDGAGRRNRPQKLAMVLRDPQD
ncbi:uncharacterized protein LOC133924991 [Phragmites australis]|uniref:uncharacterized protein LOC133924991 n=1 Tax=Phragmites australis TaxID=29695 RepID=UPI002D787F08|nr:uncharacterized protein LOC133924991 [Phragmites australis]